MRIPVIVIDPDGEERTVHLTEQQAWSAIRLVFEDEAYSDCVKNGRERITLL